ncbi:MAG TPA: hypothetical protein VGJ07_27285 [Rugosimonospora sp.]|jgi:hypothetical protein
MTVGISTANLANQWLNMIKGTAFTAPAATWVELHTGDPGASGTSNVSVGSTTRLQVLTANWTNAASGVLAMTAAIGPWTNGGTSETLTHIAVFSASSAGTFYWSAALSSSQAWASGNTFTLNTNTVTMSPLAA